MDLLLSYKRHNGTGKKNGGMMKERKEKKKRERSSKNALIWFYDVL